MVNSLVHNRGSRSSFLLTLVLRHYPLGLSYDILCISEPSYRHMEGAKSIPWDIKVHFRNYPAAHLFRDQSAATAQDFFMSMIKEV